MRTVLSPELLLLYILFTVYTVQSQITDTNWIVYTTSNTGLPYNLVQAMAVDTSGKKWIGIKNVENKGGLAIFDGTIWTIYDTSNSLLPDNDVTSLAIDNAGVGWIGTRDGLVSYDGNM